MKREGENKKTNNFLSPQTVNKIDWLKQNNVKHISTELVQSTTDWLFYINYIDFYFRKRWIEINGKMSQLTNEFRIPELKFFKIYFILHI